MKNLIAILFAVGFTVVGFAQKQDFTKSGDSDPVAEEILNRISKKYEAYKTIEAAFSLEIEIPEEETEIQTGKMKTEGDKFNIDFGDYSMISNGKDFWFHSKRNKEVQLNSASEIEAEENMMNPKDFFNFHKKGKYLYALVNENFENGKAIQQIEFKPLEDESEYSKIRMTIEKKTNSISRIKVFSKDGSRFVLKIDKLTPNKAFASTAFQFDKSKYPDVHIEDLRID